MNTVLEVKEDGQIWLIPDAPTDPRDMIPAEEFSPYVSSYAAPYLKQYEKELASAERYLVGNQEVGRKLILATKGKSVLAEANLSKVKPGIYPIPDLKWEVKEVLDYVASNVTPFGSVSVNKKVAVISLPESEKAKQECSFKTQCEDEPTAYKEQFCGCYNERKRLLIEMMQEDEKYGMYKKSDNELIAEFMGLIPEEGRGLFGLGKPVTFWCIKPGGIGVAERLLKYHCSWDWLMPVVEKISRIRCAPLSDVDYSTYHPRTFGMLDTEGKPMVRIHAHGVFTGDTLIQAAYDAVVDFVKLYNQQSK